MSDTTTVKRTTRRKTAAAFPNSPVSSDVSNVTTAKRLKTQEESFGDLISTITKAKEEFTALQKEIAEVKEAWVKGQQLHTITVVERSQQEETARKREQELYEYETKLKRRQEEDEFLERKTKWEKDLNSRKEEIEQGRRELEELRKTVSGFEAEKAKAVKEACTSIEKELTQAFAAEKKLREQEVKAEKELFALRISNMTSDNSRLNSEIGVLKRSLEEATKQLKDVAVKVIESASSASKTLSSQEIER